MRINKVQLAGLAVVLAGGVGATDANANDVNITTSTTTPLVTSSPDGVSPGDVTVATGGTITIAAGQTAVTIDSNNDVTIDGGTITSNDVNNTTGIRVTGNRTGNIINDGTLSALESYVLADTDNDGNLDGEFALGSNRHGIVIDAGSTLTGDITNEGTIVIEGNNSSGITISGVLDGDLTSIGSISVTGDNSFGVAILGGVTGDVRLAGPMTVRGENSVGVVVDAVIDGQLRLNGTWAVTGFHSTQRPADISTLDPGDDDLIGGAAVLVNQSVLSGITVEGIGVEDDQDDDDDGNTEANGDADDDASAAIGVYGSAPAIHIQADTNNIVIGAAPTGFGLHVQGSVAAFGVFDNIDATAIRIEGLGGNTVSIADGIAVDGFVQAAAANADVIGLALGANANVSELLVRRSIGVLVTSDLAQTAQAVVIESGATLPSLTNSGSITAQVFGEIGDATSIIDQSNTLATITNSGSITAQVIATDADPSDNIPPPPVTGQMTAIDVSASTIDVTLNQIADVSFTDEDAVDDDFELRPDTLIRGDILFGSGSDTINLLAGEIIGDVSFGVGNDSFVIDNGAAFAGSISDSDGALTINVIDGTLAHTGGTTNLTSATFGGDSILGILLSETPGASTFIHSTGTITFDVGAEIVPIVPEGLPNLGTEIFLTADGGLIGAANVLGVVSNVGSPYLYNLSIDTVLGDPNSLAASYQMRTAAELGLNANQTIIFSNLIDALRLDDDAAAAFASLDSEFAFFDAYADLMPTYASANTELATTAIQQMQSATTNRMAHTRLHGLDEVSVWVQEIAYAVNREPLNVNAQEFRGHGFGFSGGIDGPLDNGAMFGLSAAFIATEAEEPDRPEGEVASWFGQANAYLGTAMGPIDLDFVLGGGFGKMQSRRFVEIGSSYSALTEADWWAYEAHGAARASMPMAVADWFVITPQASVTYVYLNEEGYTEEGGGDAIDFEADSAASQRLWADLGVEFSTRFSTGGQGFIAPRIYAGYRANAIDEEAERTFRYVSGGSDFTLTDEPLGDGGPVVGIGMDATNGYTTFSIGYEGEFGDQIERHSLNAALRFRF